MDIEDLKIFGIMAIVLVGVSFLANMGIENRTKECQQNCQKLNMEYFNHVEGGFFSPSSCWCSKNNESKQIY